MFRPDLFLKLPENRAILHEWVIIESRDLIAKKKANQSSAMNTGSSTGRQKQA